MESLTQVIGNILFCFQVRGIQEWSGRNVTETRLLYSCHIERMWFDVHSAVCLRKDQKGCIIRERLTFPPKRSSPACRELSLGAEMNSGTKGEGSRAESSGRAAPAVRVPRQSRAGGGCACRAEPPPAWLLLCSGPGAHTAAAADAKVGKG